MRSFSLVLLNLIVLFGVVTAEKDLLLVSNLNSNTGYNTFFSIGNPDEERVSKAVDLSDHDLDANRNYLSQACVCDGTYYSIWDDIGSYQWGITGIRVDNSTTQNNDLDIFEIGNTKHFFHSLGCGPSKNELIGIGNIPEQDLCFSLISLDISDKGNPIETVLYDGFDNIQGNLWDTQFTPIPDLQEMWAIISTTSSITVKNQLYRVPFSQNAEPKIYDIDFSAVPMWSHSPIFSYFVTNMGSTTGGVMAILNNMEAQDFYLTNFTFDDERMIINIKPSDLVRNNNLYSKGISIPVDLDGKLYFTNPTSQTISVVDGKSEKFEVVNEFTFTSVGLPYKAPGGLQVV